MTYHHVRNWLLTGALGITLALAAQGFAHAPAPAAAAPGIQFGVDGFMLSLRTRAGGANLIQIHNPGHGFYLLSFNGRSTVKTPLRRVVLSGHTLVVSSERGLPRFTFNVSHGSCYLALSLMRVQGLPRKSLASLNFNINAAGALKGLSLDYMTTLVNRGGNMTIHWPYLWHRNPTDPLGGIALYEADTPKGADNALAQIWADTDFPHPAIGKPWTVERVKAWVHKYAERFGDQTTMYIAPHNAAQLYKLTQFARQAGVKVMYLFSNVWSDGFWENSFTQVSVNRKVFPNGREDLEKYATYLHKRGMMLALHYVSGGIGPFVGKLMKDKTVLDGLAAWANGTLAQKVNAKAGTLYFRPDTGDEYPLVTSNPAGPGELGAYFSTKFVRVGSEIVKVGKFEDLDKPVWKLVGCQRGYGATKAAAHAAGVSCAGLDSAYGQVFSPSADSPLMVRMARQWADFVNQVGVDHFSYDGYEDQFTVPWGGVKYSNLVASYLDRPVTTNTSGGVPVSSNLEMKFSAVKKIHQFGYGSVNLSIKLAANSPASSMLGASFEIPAGISTGARRFMILKPDPMFGISLATLDHYGLTERMVTLFRMWKHALGQMTPAQLADIASTMAPAWRYNHLSQAGGHPAGRDCFVISRLGDEYHIVPTRVMVRQKGDVRWLVGQEFGPVSPCQYIHAGTPLMLKNPYKPQPAGFVIHVLSATVPGKSGSIQPPPTAIDTKTKHTAISGDGDGIVIRAANPLAQGQWITHGLPTWQDSFSMAKGRGLSMQVTGDGGGEVLLLQIHGGGTRDYVVKINFKGKRTIVIPNGEASWANGYWGWRMGSKNIDYAHIHSVSIGFGYLPPQSHADVRVAHLMVLADQPAKLANPIVTTGKGSLSVTGSVPSGDYLEYQGGAAAEVYDRNWNKIQALPVKTNKYEMPNGYAPVEVKVTSAAGELAPWLRCQFITRGTPMIVPSRTGR